jgi:hypothetical protein
MPEFTLNIDKFVMTCGCVYTKEQVHAGSGKYKCPVHNGNLEYIVRNCLGCDKELIIEPAKGNTRYCAECALERKRASKSASRNKALAQETIRKKPSSPAQLASEACWDCVHRSECLSYAIIHDNRVLPCLDCKDYISVVINTGQQNSLT